MLSIEVLKDVMDSPVEVPPMPKLLLLLLLSAGIPLASPDPVGDVLCCANSRHFDIASSAASNPTERNSIQTHAIAWYMNGGVMSKAPLATSVFGCITGKEGWVRREAEDADKEKIKFLLERVFAAASRIALCKTLPQTYFLRQTLLYNTQN